jgi:protein phosphatase 2C family protein 2/3
MKKAFLGTDEDILLGQFFLRWQVVAYQVFLDPSHTRDPSGCTAVAALVTHDGKIYVVSSQLYYWLSVLIFHLG